MKTFLPVISPSLNPWHTMRLSLEALDNKRLGKQRVESYQIYRSITGLNHTKSWRTSPAIHMWRGYPDALGVYIYLNCVIWSRRKSETTGKNFSNALMNQHIQTYKFGQNHTGQLVYEFEPLIEGSTGNDINALDADAEEASSLSNDDDENKSVASVQIPLPVAMAAAAIADSSPVAPPDSAFTVSDAADSTVSGKYVDGIRIPWWFHDARIHDSDAAILYSKDKKFYRKFAKQYKKYKEYVWPRDIDPYHPEQKLELDQLQVILDAEEEARVEKREKKKAERLEMRKNRKRKSENQSPEPSSIAASVEDDLEMPILHDASSDEAISNLGEDEKKPRLKRQQLKPKRAVAAAAIAVSEQINKDGVPHDVISPSSASAVVQVSIDVHSKKKRKLGTGMRMQPQSG